MAESSELLSCVEIEPTAGTADSAVIWLHGLGADGHDFESIVPHFDLGGAATRFVFPNAPSIPVTVNGGFVMPAWYDIEEVDLRKKHDLEGVEVSCRHIRDLIEREAQRGIPAGRTVLAGFSQGGAIALHLGLRFEERLAGILGLSTYLLDAEGLERAAHPANRDTSLFQAHGRFDPMVPFERGEAARDALLALEYEVHWHEYPMQHEVCMDEIRDVGSWLKERLNA